MLVFQVTLALGLFVAFAEQGKSGWNNQVLYDSSNFINTHHKRSHLKRLDVVCGKDQMTIHMEFDKVFDGVVFSQTDKPHHRCVHVGPRAGVRQVSFHIAYDSCGTTEDLTGHFHENTIIVQYGYDVLEAWDEAKRLRCEWLETYEKSSSNQQLHIADLDVVELNFQGDDIDCWMEIQEGKGPWSRKVAGLVPLGSPLTLVIAINDNSREFDMRVTECKAHDDKGSTIDLTDKNGCVLRSTLLTPFVKVRDFSSKATLIAYSHLYAFKFPDHLDVYVKCIVEICRHGCVDACGGTSTSKFDSISKKALQNKLSSKYKKEQSAVRLIHVPVDSSPGRKKKPMPTYTEKPFHQAAATIPHFDSQRHSPNFDLTQMIKALQDSENKLQKHKLSGVGTVSHPFTEHHHQHHTIESSYVSRDDKKPFWIEPQPEPNSFAHPHHVTMEQLLASQQKAAEPQPEPNSFAHPHHITTEQLLAAQQIRHEPQPEPNSFAHPHHITTEQLLAAQQIRHEPQPEPNSFAHPHHITTEQLLAGQKIRHEPQPEPNSFAHPHHMTTEQLLAAQQIRHEPQPEPNSFAHPHHITTEQLLSQQNRPDPQPEPNSFAHPHHITTEQLLGSEHKAALLPLQQNSFAHSSHGTSEQLLSSKHQTENSQLFVHPQYMTTEQLLEAQGQKNAGSFPHITDTAAAQHWMFPAAGKDNFKYAESSPSVTKIRSDLQRDKQASVITVTLKPNGQQVLRYNPHDSSTRPQPVYVPKVEIINSNIGLNRQFTQFQNITNNKRFQYETITFKPKSKHPYPIPQFSPRQQPVSQIAEKRMDDDIDELEEHDDRQPITSFLPQTGDSDNLKKVPHGPRLLRVRRSEPVFGVEQKFRAIAPADLAFELNATEVNAEIFRGRREEIIYGVCMSTARFSLGLGMIMFLTICSTVTATFLFHRFQILLKVKNSSRVSNISTLFNGQVERLYTPNVSNQPVVNIVEFS